MKKLIAIAAMAMVIGATVSRAQTTNSVTVSNGVTIVAGPISLDIKVKLNGATKLAAPAVSGVEAALVEGDFGGTSNNLSFVLGTTVLDSSSVITTSGTSTVTISNTVTSSISSNAWVETDTPVEFGKGKFAAGAFAVTNGLFGSSNLVAFITGTVKAAKSGPVEEKASSSNSTSTVSLSAKAVGVWAEGVSTFSATINTAK